MSLPVQLLNAACRGLSTAAAAITVVVNSALSVVAAGWDRCIIIAEQLFHPNVRFQDAPLQRVVCTQITVYFVNTACAL